MLVGKGELMCQRRPPHGKCGPRVSMCCLLWICESRLNDTPFHTASVPASATLQVVCAVTVQAFVFSNQTMLAFPQQIAP